MDFELVVGIDDENSESHDLKLKGGNLQFVSGDDAVGQQIRIRFQFFQGEWFLDARQGVPYFRDVFIKAPSKRLLVSLFTRIIETTPGIARVLTMTYELNSARELTLNFSALLDSGKVFTAADFNPFIVDDNDSAKLKTSQNTLSTQGAG